MKHAIRIRTREAGVGIVTAIFLLVVLAGLAVAMVGIYTAQQSSANVDLLGARAYQAARAGLEWGIFRQTRNGVCGAQSTFQMPAGTSLSGFTVVVTCKRQGGGAMFRHVLTSTACNLPAASGACPSVSDSAAVMNNPEFVQRKLEAEL